MYVILKSFMPLGSDSHALLFIVHFDILKYFLQKPEWKEGELLQVTETL